MDKVKSDNDISNGEDDKVERLKRRLFSEQSRIAADYLFTATSDELNSAYKNRKIVYVDMDDVLCKYSAGLAAYKADHPDVEFPQSMPGFFRGLEPMEGAIEAIEEFRAADHIDVHILSAPSVKNPLSYSEKRLWVEDHLGYFMAENLILIGNKGLVKGAVLIDDYDQGRGQENFEGRLIQYGTDEYPDWHSVLEALRDDGTL